MYNRPELIRRSRPACRAPGTRAGGVGWLPTPSRSCHVPFSFYNDQQRASGDPWFLQRPLGVKVRTLEGLNCPWGGWVCDHPTDKLPNRMEIVTGKKALKKKKKNGTF